MDAPTRSPLRRMIAAVAAATTTLALFNAVVAISEPGRSQWIAAQQRHQAPPPAPTTAIAHADRGARPVIDVE
jgi:hypothetical protein